MWASKFGLEISSNKDHVLLHYICDSEGMRSVCNLDLNQLAEFCCKVHLSFAAMASIAHSKFLQDPSPECNSPLKACRIIHASKLHSIDIIKIKQFLLTFLANLPQFPLQHLLGSWDSALFAAFSHQPSGPSTFL